MDLVTTGTILVVGKKLLGKTLDVVSDDISKIYTIGRDKILSVATKKTPNIDDGFQANLRVTRDVFWNGSFTDEGICAEYFGGILASSRSKDGKDDTGVFFVDIIKSLSSGQLKMHYLIYRSLNKILIADKTKENINPGNETELQDNNICFPSRGGVIEQFENSDIGAILHGLHSKGLIGDFQVDNQVLEDSKILPYIKVAPTTLGVQLFAIANNMFGKWRNYSTIDFGDSDSVNLPRVYGQSIDSILEKLKLKEKDENVSK